MIWHLSHDKQALEQAKMTDFKGTSFNHEEQVISSRCSSVIKAAPLPDNKLVTSDTTMRGLSDTIPDLKGLVEAAKAATDADHKMGALEAIKAYPKAVCFSVM